LEKAYRAGNLTIIATQPNFATPATVYSDEKLWSE
jgi:hypothetical protein